MMVMWEREVVSEKEIGEALYLKSNTLTDTLRLMEKKGLIEKTRDKGDKRKLVIKITEQGKKLKEKAINVPKTLEQEHWLTDEELIEYKRLLHKLLDQNW